MPLKYLIPAFVLPLLFSCNRPETYQPDAFAFVTLLGQDTLAVEDIRIEPGKVSVKAILRSPRLSFLTYEMSLGADYEMSSFSAAAWKTPGMQEEDLIEKYDITFSTDRDSLQMVLRSPDEIIVYNFSTASAVLPFLDMIHWPFEILSGKMAAQQLTTLTQPMFSGRRTVNFEATKTGSDTLFIKHPTRGTMWSLVDEKGSILYLDAGSTTRKLKVYRTASVDYESLATQFLVSEEAGKGVGELSGRAETTASIGELNLTVDYGQPLKRGRALFGAIVPWGKRWRTGANKATHLYLDKAIQMRDLQVPAGEYTLFSIPEAEGGVLIINKQTGQNGQSYDEEQDLGRVSMEIGTLDTSVERFTIDAVETGTNQGQLRLMWGNTVFSVPFTVL